MKSGQVTVNTLIEYDDVVNIENVTGLSGKHDVKFFDQLQLVPGPKSKLLKPQNNVKSKLKKKAQRTTTLLQKLRENENTDVFENES